jgi:hypothetical protein
MFDLEQIESSTPAFGSAKMFTEVPTLKTLASNGMISTEARQRDAGRSD